MSINGLTGIRKELFPCYEAMMKKCKWKGKRFDGTPMYEPWTDFDIFVKDNWFRYCRAKIKWQGYTRKAERVKKGYCGELKLKPVWFIRYKKELGYFKENTVFTNPSDGTKNASCCHKYMFEDRMLGTRDILNILKKRGIEISMESLRKRLINGRGLFETNLKRGLIKYKDKQMSFAEIARQENISYDILKKYYYITKNIDYAVKKGKINEAEKKIKELKKIANGK